MKLVAEQGLWTVGPVPPEPPTVAVVEVAGAVLAWPVDDPAALRLTFTDVRAADWLWRVTGEAGHVAVLRVVQGRPADARADIEVADLALSATALAPLRRLAIGHWLRRWWPASVRDGIADLDMAVLDAELAVLTAAVQEFFVEDTLDSDVDGLLRPHRHTFAALLRGGDPRVSALIEACLEIADGLDLNELEPLPARRDDYALAAGGSGPSTGLPIARGTASISWSAVPPGIFDAAEDTVDWSVHADGAGGAVLTVRAEILGPAGGVPVGLRAGDLTAAGSFQADGTAAVALPITESAAWNQDWSAAVLDVGTGAGETRAVRDRLRALVRDRLRGAPDAFLAEVLAAESDY